MEFEAWHRRFWNAWVGREERRDRDPEKQVHTALVWRTLERYLPGIETVLDAGAGPGRFSLPLARRGLKVTHLDLAPAMVARARQRAEQEGLELEFVVGSLRNLPWPDRRFDLVLCLDAPVSYVFPPSAAIGELARVTGRWLVVSVVNRLGQVPVGLKLEARWRKDFSFTRAFIDHGDWFPPPRWLRLPVVGRRIFPPLHAFTPQEFLAELEKAGLEPVEVSATGTLARLVGRRTLRRILRHPQCREDFLNLCESLEVRSEFWGVGAEGAAGLLAVCRPRARADAPPAGSDRHGLAPA
ncbi:MAG: methyltransferase domain-containing protein [Clostridia bacterium]|jgi:SAM-dependent methyltransferase|nr:class I SAM-dependent methyltransferase [Clostridia bacterium]MDH7573372.1 methyltransferase domain-containing protein [Clostridia bacterium]